MAEGGGEVEGAGADFVGVEMGALRGSSVCSGGVGRDSGRWMLGWLGGRVLEVLENGQPELLL